MKYFKYQGILRHLLRLHPLNLDEESTLSITTYSLRRFLPSVADGVKLSIEDLSLIHI